MAILNNHLSIMSHEMHEKQINNFLMHVVQHFQNNGRIHARKMTNSCTYS